MKRYLGDRTIDGIVVTVDGVPLDQQLAIAAYTDQGFEWSYLGAEPRQLALALLVDHLGQTHSERAEALSERFMQHVVASLGNDWELTTQDIDDALAALGS